MTAAFYAVHPATECGCRATITICHDHRQDHAARSLIVSWMLTLLGEYEVEARGSDT